MLATEAMPTDADRIRGFGTVGFVFALLLKFNTLMALSAASLPFPVPANVRAGIDHDLRECRQPRPGRLAHRITGPAHRIPRRRFARTDIER